MTLGFEHIKLSYMYTAEQLKKKLLQTDPEFAKSYEIMYKMLESTEN